MTEETSLFAAFVPPIGLVLRVLPLTIAYAAAWAALAGWLRAKRGVRTPLTRKVFHFAIFTAAAAVHLAWSTPGVVVFGVGSTLVVLYGVWRGDGHAFYEALARPGDAPHRTLFIIVPLITTAVGGVLANLLFQPYAFVGYVVSGWGDAVGEPVGTLWGRHRYRVPSLAGVPATRSLEGSAAVLLLGAIGAALALVIGGTDARSALAVGVICGAAGAVVEAISSHGLDNLTVQLAGAGMAWGLLA